MDAENRADGEDGKPETTEESSSSPASSEGVSPSAETQAAEPAGQAILRGAGEAVPQLPSVETQEAGDTPDAGDTQEPEEAREPESSVSEPASRLLGQTILDAILLEQLEDDATFRIRPEGEISKLATDVARLGQLFSVDVRPRESNRYQIICGFRRVAALRFLKRDRVQVRIHPELSDEDALLMALAAAIHASPVERPQLESWRARLEAEGRLSAATRDMLDKALETEDTLAPESMEEEVDADELAADAAQRLGALNQDLSLLADVFNSLDESRRAELLMQLRYSAELVAYLEGL
jgi:ParB-like chromosome segregation protein Spo0J